MIGALMYLTSSRPDIVQAVCYYARYQARPMEKHLKKQLWEVIYLGDKLVSWMSKKQDCTAMSSAEAEYVALSASYAQVMWMRTQLKDYGFDYNKISLYCDSQSAIAISCNPVQHSRTKHINVRYQFINEQVKRGIIELYFVKTVYQLVDIFTKALLEDRFDILKNLLDRVSQLHYPFSLPERLKADNTISLVLDGSYERIPNLNHLITLINYRHGRFCGIVLSLETIFNSPPQHVHRYSKMFSTEREKLALESLKSHL
ncbi:hypothetical protein Tco_1531077 [Tanacetum coccineum]